MNAKFNGLTAPEIAELASALRVELGAAQSRVDYLKAELEQLEPTRCVGCWEAVPAGCIDRAGECYDCARGVGSEPDETAEHLAAYHRSIAGGCR